MTTARMRFDIVSIFPHFFGSPADGTGLLGHGVLSRALRESRAAVHVHDLRAYTHDRHRTVDDRPFGGGEGMVLKPQPVLECCTAMGVGPRIGRDLTRESVVLLSAQGRPFTQSVAHELSRCERVVMVCGRYEGVDERVNDLLCDRELSIGDYVLSGGELAAAVIVDAVVRLLPGVLGHNDSARFESFGAVDEGPGGTHDGVPRATHGAGGLLDYPQYTRPAEWQGLPIPAPLAGGDHALVRRWRREAALAKTLHNRPDLLAHAALTQADRAFLDALREAEAKKGSTG